jgi:hypothetical protein
MCTLLQLTFGLEDLLLTKTPMLVPGYGAFQKIKIIHYDTYDRKNKY